MDTATLIADIYQQIQQLKHVLSEYNYLKEYLNSGILLQVQLQEALKSDLKSQLSAKLQEMSAFISKQQSFEITSEELALLCRNERITSSLHRIQEQILALQHSISE